MNHPIENIEWRHAMALISNDYNPNIVYNPELKLLELSMLDTGWIQPILINTEGVIIDGFHRVQLAMNSAALLERDGGMVPCAVLDVSDKEAMMLTIRMNRAKGTHVGIRMSGVVKRLVDTHGVSLEEIAIGIGATRAEMELLYAGNVFVQKDIKNAKYSQAWIPVEEP